MGAVQLYSLLKPPGANSLQEFLHTEGQSYMQATYLLPEKPELRMGLGRKLVELDSALVPISSTLVCGARHTPKPFQLRDTTMRLLLEPKHLQSAGLGPSTRWKGLGANRSLSSEPLVPPGRRKTWGHHTWGDFYCAAPWIGSRAPAIFTEGCSTVTETHTEWVLYLWTR